jgi:hypothetical protein
LSRDAALASRSTALALGVLSPTAIIVALVAV